MLGMDHLHTHTPAALYAAFPPAEAKRRAERLAIHSTPQHGSWLNLAEIALSVVAAQCLDRRLPDRGAVEGEVASWAAARNAATKTIDWRCTTADAHLTLKPLYPSFDD